MESSSLNNGKLTKSRGKMKTHLSLSLSSYYVGKFIVTPLINVNLTNPLMLHVEIGQGSLFQMNFIFHLNSKVLF